MNTSNNTEEVHTEPESLATGLLLSSMVWVWLIGAYVAVRLFVCV